MAPSMIRATTVLELQSKNTPLFATVRVNKAGQKEYVNPLCQRTPVVHVSNVSTGRRTDASDDGITCLELFFWSQGHGQSTDPDFTADVAVPSSWTEHMYLRAIDTTIKNLKGISILPASTLSPGYNSVNCVHFLFDMPNDNVEFIKMMSGLVPRHAE
jgi:hypothetical protein